MSLQNVKSHQFNHLSNAIKVYGHLLSDTQPKSSSAKNFKLNISAPPQPPQSSCPSTLYSDSTYTKLVRSATKSQNLIQGKFIHTHMIKSAFKPSLFLLNTLLNMYCKCGDIYSADRLFLSMSRCDIVTYNSLLSGYTQVGYYHRAVILFNEARMISLKLDRFTYSIALNICNQTRNLNLGKSIHGLILINRLGDQVILINSLIDMYSKCGQIDHARILFENSDNLDDVSWNSLISGYAQNKAYEEMLKILVTMHQKKGTGLNTYTLGSVLKACTYFDPSKKFGKMLHACAIKLGLDLDLVVGTALLDMYAKTGNLDNALQIFEIIPNQNVVLYNAMISGLLYGNTVEDESAYKALNLFSKMQSKEINPSKFTFSSILKACNVVEAFELGKQIHAQICKNGLSDEYICTALIDLYSLSGSMNDALTCFHSIPSSDIVSLTAMIVGYLQNGQSETALALFYDLLAQGKKPDEFILSSLLCFCANLATVRSGEQIQGYVIKTGFWEFTIIQNSQVSMYAKSGDIFSANAIFNEMEYPDVVSWSGIICSNAQHGNAEEALRLFALMKESGTKPNHITFLGVLTACSHGGQVEEGLRQFESIKRDYGIKIHVKHCACMVDLLGRHGKLSDAEDFILHSGFKNQPVIWRALLSACRIYKDTIIGKRIAERLMELEPQASSSYVLLYNIYTDSRFETAASEIRGLMQERRIKKEPGLSWIEVGNKVHSFVVGDRSHMMSQWIYEKLEEMMEKIKKMNLLDEMPSNNYHSEKLAVAFGIMCLPKSAPVRVMKNLRVCKDCHATMKLLSIVEKRVIILRDPIRFHHFKDGSCSCRDFW